MSVLAPTILILEDQEEALRGLLSDLYDAGVVEHAPPEQLQWRIAREAYLKSLIDCGIPILVCSTLDRAYAVISEFPIDFAILDLTVRRPEGGEDRQGGLAAARRLAEIQPDAVRTILTGASREVLEGADPGLLHRVFTKGKRGTTFQEVSEFALTWLGGRARSEDQDALLRWIIDAWGHSWPWCSEETAVSFLHTVPALDPGLAPVTHRASRVKGSGGPRGAGRSACTQVGRIADLLLTRRWEDRESTMLRASALARSGGPIARAVSSIEEGTIREALRAWHKHLDGLCLPLRQSEPFQALATLEDRAARTNRSDQTRWLSVQSAMMETQQGLLQLGFESNLGAGSEFRELPRPPLATDDRTQEASSDIGTNDDSTIRPGESPPVVADQPSPVSQPQQPLSATPVEGPGAGGAVSTGGGSQLPTEATADEQLRSDSTDTPGGPGPIEPANQSDIDAPADPAQAASHTRPSPDETEATERDFPVARDLGRGDDSTSGTSSPASPSAPTPPVARGPSARPSGRHEIEAAQRRHAEAARNDPWNGAVVRVGAFNAGELPNEPETPENLPAQHRVELRDCLAETPADPPGDLLRDYFRGRVVWIIDDHVATWEACFRDVLGDACTLATFTTVDEAIRHVEETAPDVIILDLYVPIIRDHKWPCAKLSEFLGARRIGPSADLSVPDPRHAELCLDLLTDVLPAVPVLVFTRSREARLARRALVEWGAAGFAFKNSGEVEGETPESEATRVFSDLRDSLLLALRRRADWHLRLPLRRLERREPEVRDLRQWIDQFEAVDRPLALDMASRIRRVDAAALERMFDDAVARLIEDPDWNFRAGGEGIVFVAAGRQGKSGPSMFYQLWHLPRLAPFRKRIPMVLLKDVEDATEDRGKLCIGDHALAITDVRIVLVDDFVGSGGTALSAAKTVATRLGALGVADPASRTALLAACGIPKGMEAIGTAFGKVWVGDSSIPVLDDSASKAAAAMGERLRLRFGRVIAGQARVHPRDPRAMLLRPDGDGRLRVGDLAYTASSRAPQFRVQRQEGRDYTAVPLSFFKLKEGPFVVDTCLTPAARTYEPLGFGDSAALLAFDYNIPNNCPPVLWGSENGWRPLFVRRT